MVVKHETRIKETATNKPNAVTNIILSDSAAAGFRPIVDAYSDNDRVPYDCFNGVDWESGLGTFIAGTPNQLARTDVYASSSSNDAVDFSGGGDLILTVGWSAQNGQQFEILKSTAKPGGRLTLESGVPVSTTDQVSKTTIYYTPHLSDVIPLFDGDVLNQIKFSEISLALGTVIAGRPYDVFAFLNAGVLEIEILAWTDEDSRATAITIVDSLYVKSGDKTRLFLGTIMPKTTTEIEDSLVFRGVWNNYNKIQRKLIYSTGSTSHTFTAPSGSKYQEWAGASGVHVFKFVLGLDQSVPTSISVIQLATDTDSKAVSIIAYDGAVVDSYPANGAPQTTQYETKLKTAIHYLSATINSAKGAKTYSIVDRVFNNTQTLTANYATMDSTVSL